MAIPPRRIVTGHDAQGRAVIQSDGPVTRTRKIGGEVGPYFHEVWSTQEAPARIDRASGEPEEDGIILAPPANGTRIRILDVPPDDDKLAALSPEEARAVFGEIGASDANSHGTPTARHAFMHRTESIDYGIVLEGEIVLIVDEGETLVKTGDVVIQRGTNHAWANRSGANCRIAFILIDASFEDGLG